MTGVQIRVVGEDEAEMRLDRWFRSHFPDLGHGRLEKLLRTGQVRVDGKRAKSSTRLAPGQNLRVPPLDAPDPNSGGAGGREAAGGRRPARGVAARAVSDEDAAWLERALLYRDDDVLVIDKPAGLAVQGGSGQTRHLDAMLDALRFEARDAPRLVHRLDKDTSGVLVLARSRVAARSLTEAFRDNLVEKTYWAAVLGVPQKAVGLIDLPLAKGPPPRDQAPGQARDQDDDSEGGSPGGERMWLDEEAGKPALSVYALADHAANKAAWLLLRPMTGRTHQLRVHCAALGLPILGDGKYGGREAFPRGLPRVLGQLKRMQLHAREIALPHPGEGTTLRVRAPLPDDMAATWAALGFHEATGEARGDEALTRYLDSLPKSLLAV